MEKITINICFGTTCFVMGSSKLEQLESQLPEHLIDKVNIRYSTCLNCCKNNEYSKSPYALVDGEIISGATVDKIITAIENKIHE